jgi:hypothetical protein
VIGSNSKQVRSVCVLLIRGSGANKSEIGLSEVSMGLHCICCSFVFA